MEKSACLGKIDIQKSRIYSTYPSILALDNLSFLGNGRFSDSTSRSLLWNHPTNIWGILSAVPSTMVYDTYNYS